MGRDEREHRGLFVLFEALAAGFGADRDTAETIGRAALEEMGDADLDAITALAMVEWIRTETGVGSEPTRG